MKIPVAIILGFMIVGFSAHGGAQTNVQEGSGCILDEKREETYLRANQKSKAMTDALFSYKKPTLSSCLPSLKDIGASISASIPDIGTVLSNLARRVTDHVCSEADSAIRENTQIATEQWKAPYGLGGITAGGGGCANGDLNCVGVSGSAASGINSTVQRERDEYEQRFTPDNSTAPASAMIGRSVEDIENTRARQKSNATQNGEQSSESSIGLF